MKEREPGILYGLNLFDFVKIGLAFMLSLAGFYLIWRSLFGPPLFEPSAVQAELRRLQTQQQASHRAAAPQNPDVPSEVTVGIAPSRPSKTP